jgi:demethylmenaquinone methyltransferase/2-methoxy-6-polyprenyl-1,4-benzoquinol methylase
MIPQDIYDSAYVRELFEEMSTSYRLTNLISSFGFSKIWRDQCVSQADISPDATVYELMAGNGDSFSTLLGKLNQNGKIIAVDFCRRMCEQAKARKEKLAPQLVTVLEQDVLTNEFPSESADVVISAFGLKTFSDEQKQILAGQVHRLLKPGGRFSLLEISVPANCFLRCLYMFYLRRLIPLIGWLMLGNPDNYRMLGVYTQRFQDCRRTAQIFELTGLKSEYRLHFFGCATSIVGQKPLGI